MENLCCARELQFFVQFYKTHFVTGVGLLVSAVAGIESAALSQIIHHMDSF